MKISAHLPSLHESLGHLAVAAPVAGGDEVGHAAALQEGGGGHGARGAEDPGEGDHLHQTQPDHCCLRVVPETQTVTETGSDRNDVLRTRESVKKEMETDLDTMDRLQTN